MSTEILSHYIIGTTLTVLLLGLTWSCWLWESEHHLVNDGGAPSKLVLALGEAESWQPSKLTDKERQGSQLMS